MALDKRVTRIDITDETGAGPVKVTVHAEIFESDPTVDRVFGKRYHTLEGQLPRAGWNQLVAALKAKRGQWPVADVALPVTEDP